MTDCIRRKRSYWTTCPCDNCTRDRLRKGQHYHGGIPWRVPNDTAWDILAAKIDAGYTARALGSATGLDKPGTLQGHLYFSRHVAEYRKGRRVLLGPAVAKAIVNMGVPTEGQVGAEPSRRRLRALAVMGYGLDELAKESGIGFSTLAAIRNNSERVGAALALKITELYDRLHMTPGPNQQARDKARDKGWPAPLAWNDIETDDTPNGNTFCRHKGCVSAASVKGLCMPHYRLGRGEVGGDVDPITVNRILAGEWKLPSNVPEKREVCRRWVAQGGSLRQLEKASGWRVHRYYKAAGDEAA